MKKRLLAVMLSLMLVLGSFPLSVLAEDDSAAVYGTPGEDYVAGEVIVRVKGGAEALNSGTRARSAASAYQVEELMSLSGDSDTATPYSRSAAVSDSLVLVKGDDTETMLDTLEDNPAVVWAEPNYLVTACDVPEDPGYPYQWGLDNQQEESAADINAEAAWQTGSGTPGSAEDAPVVAVLDSGVDYNHPDLKNVMWDDGEAYPELTALGGGTYGLNCTENGNPSSDPMDTTIGHGTHCASIIASQWNDLGGAGVDGDVQIMAVNFLDGASPVSAIILGYRYIITAREAGVNVVAVNNSWGGTSFDTRELYSTSTVVTEAGEKGIVSCFAAGNESSNRDLNTGSFSVSPYLISVGAMNAAGDQAYFSNYGRRTVDVFAPGVDILAATTTDTAKLDMDHHEMPVQYLPWIQAATDSVFYEDFEADRPQISLSLARVNGETLEVLSDNAGTAGEGYVSDRGMQVDLSAIGEGETFAIGIGFDADALTGLDLSQSVYLAGVMGTVNTGANTALYLYTENADGTLTDANSVYKQEYVNGNYTLYAVRQMNGTWNVATGKLANAADVLKDANGDGTITLWVKGTMTDMTDQAPVFCLDDVGIGTAPSAYYYSSGTSMACPMVTGIVAVLSQQYSDGTAAGAAEICARVKGGVHTSDSVADTCVTGGYVDLAASLTADTSQLNPVVNTLTQEGSTAVITGYFFGTDTGSVTIGGKTAAVSQWSDEAITVTVPEGVSGNTEVIVTAGSGRSGRNYLDVGQTSIGYTTLAVPDLTYTTVGGTVLTSADVITLNMAAAGQTVYRLGYLAETLEIVLEAYDTVSNTWHTMALPEDYMMGTTAYMAGGKDKLYLYYTALQGDAGISRIGVWDGSSWQCQTVDLSGCENIAVYGDQLLAIGSEGDDGALPTVSAIDPTTGAVTTGVLPDMPDGRTLTELRVNGNMLYVIGGISSYNRYANGEDYTEYQNVLIWDGSTWKTGGDYFGDANTLFDPMQTMDTALGATDTGLILCGPVKDVGSDAMVDTWCYDAATDTFAPATDLRFNSTKTVMNAGATLKGQFYVLAYDAGSLIFRATAVEQTDPTYNPGDTEPTPEPTPNPEPTAPEGGNTSTDTAQSAGGTTTTATNAATGTAAALPAGALTLLAASVILSGVWVLRRYRMHNSR